MSRYLLSLQHYNNQETILNIIQLQDINKPSVILYVKIWNPLLTCLVLNR